MPSPENPNYLYLVYITYSAGDAAKPQRVRSLFEAFTLMTKFIESGWDLMIFRDIHNFPVVKVERNEADRYSPVITNLEA